MTPAEAALAALCAWAAPEVYPAVEHMAEVSGARVELVAALARRESRCYVTAVNAVTGAMGLFQVMPRTADHFVLGKLAVKRKRRLGPTALLDPMLNAQVAGRVLKEALRKCAGNEAHALSLYNGQGKCVDSDFAQQVLGFAGKIESGGQ